MTTDRRPTDEQLEALLRDLQPTPRPAFHERMQAAPWQPARRPRALSLGWRGALALTVVIAAWVMRPALGGWMDATNTPTSTATHTHTPTATHTEIAALQATPVAPLAALPEPATTTTPAR